MPIYITSADPGFATGAMAHLIPPTESKYPMTRYMLGARWSMPKFVGTDLQRIDQATAWFCSHLEPYGVLGTVGQGSVRILALESQSRSHYGKLSEGKSSPKAGNVALVVGGIRRHCYERRIPIRDIEPTEWRTRLGLPRNASKQQAWRVVANLLKLPEATGNQHVRDSIVIAYVGSIAVHLWLANWERERRAA